MNELIESMGAWGVPTVIISIVIGLFILMQVTGEIVEWCGKTAPAWLKLRKLVTKRRDAKKQKEEARDQALIDATKAIQEFNSHYNPTAIEKRNEWMTWVNNRAEVYDSSVKELTELTAIVKSQQESLEINNRMTSEVYKQMTRTQILDFSHKLVNARKADKPVIFSQEEFRKIRKSYEAYERFLRSFGGTNGEVDDAMEVIRRAERGELPNIEFLEDLRD